MLYSAISTMATSILDQVLSSQNQSAISQFDPEQVAAKLFSILSEREQDILVRRYGLKVKEKMTLEEIGKQYSVTRERIRQVENASINKILSEYRDSLLRDLEALIRDVLEDHGELMSENRLVQNLLDTDAESDQSKALVHFMLNQLLAERLQLVRESDAVYKTWSLQAARWDEFHSIIDRLVEIIKKHNEPLRLEQLLDRARGAVSVPEDDFERILVNYLDVTKKIEENRFK